MYEALLMFIALTESIPTPTTQQKPDYNLIFNIAEIIAMVLAAFYTIKSTLTKSLSKLNTKMAVASAAIVALEKRIDRLEDSQ